MQRDPGREEQLRTARAERQRQRQEHRDIAAMPPAEREVHQYLQACREDRVSALVQAIESNHFSSPETVCAAALIAAIDRRT